MTTSSDPLYLRAQKLGLHGLLTDWDALQGEPWIEPLLQREEIERHHRGLERRLKASRVGRFKPMADFDYKWPKKIDREQIHDLFTFQWLEQKHNVLIVGPNGVGKSMIAQNLTYEAVKRGANALFISASEMLNDLAEQDGTLSLQRRLSRYCRPRLLAIDELGYLSYDHRHADLLFEVVTRRYGERSTLITTNKPFAEWSEVFPSATCVVTLVDRLVHHAEIVDLEGDSYRLKEAKEEAAQKAKDRSARRRRKPND